MRPIVYVEVGNSPARKLELHEIKALSVSNVLSRLGLVPGAWDQNQGEVHFN